MHNSNFIIFLDAGSRKCFMSHAKLLKISRHILSDRGKSLKKMCIITLFLKLEHDTRAFRTKLYKCSLFIQVVKNYVCLREGELLKTMSYIIIVFNEVKHFYFICIM